MAIDFSAKILVTNPATYNLGRVIACAGVVALIIGITTQFTPDLLIPATAWCAFAIPIMVIGGILVACGVTKP